MGNPPENTVDKVALLVECFEKNVGLEEFYLNSEDRDGLLGVLKEQGDLIPVLIDAMEGIASNDPKGIGYRERVLGLIDKRQELEQRLRGQMLEVSQELGKLRQATQRLKVWRKAWVTPDEPVQNSSSFYA